MYRNYYAGFEGVAEIKYEPIMDLISYRLVCYHYLQSGLYDDFFKSKARKKYRSIILDSGAFSAWSAGAFINFDLYIKYCIENRDWINYFVNLDVIPTNDDRDTVAEGFRNYDKFVDKLTKNGIDRNRIIHVYHQGEDPSVLEKMISEYQIDYIGISPITIKGVDPDDIKKWLDSISHVALDGSGNPRAKYHAFGVGTTDVLDYFPFYSADSTTWATSANLGYVSVPQLRNKEATPLHLKWDFSELDNYYVGYFDDEPRHLLGATNGSYRVPRWRRIEVEEYVREVGFELGQSKLWRTSSSVNPKENEFVLEKRTQNLLEQRKMGNEQVPEGWVWIERVLVPGLRTYREYRMYVNLLASNMELYTRNPDGYKALYNGGNGTEE